MTKYFYFLIKINLRIMHVSYLLICFISTNKTRWKIIIIINIFKFLLFSLSVTLKLASYEINIIYDMNLILLLIIELFSVL